MLNCLRNFMIVIVIMALMIIFASITWLITGDYIIVTIVGIAVPLILSFIFSKK